MAINEMHQNKSLIDERYLGLPVIKCHLLATYKVIPEKESKKAIFKILALLLLSGSTFRNHYGTFQASFIAIFNGWRAQKMSFL